MTCYTDEVEDDDDGKYATSWNALVVTLLLYCFLLIMHGCATRFFSKSHY